MKTLDTLYELKVRFPLPKLLKLVGLGEYAQSGPSPIQPAGQWKIYQCSGRWCYSDETSQEIGDEIGLLAALFNLDAHQDLETLTDRYRQITRARKANRSQARLVRGNLHTLKAIHD